MSFSKYKYIIAGLLLYAAAVLYLHGAFEQPLADLLSAFFILGIGFSFIAWLFTKQLAEPAQEPLLRNERVLLLLLVLWILFYITYGGGLINHFIPKKLLENPQSNSIIVFARKLLVFVLIPFAVYKVCGFTAKDFGLTHTTVKLGDRHILLLFIVLSVAALLFQYFLSNGSKPLRDELFGSKQLFTGIPLAFIYLFFDAGLIEEFFFRALLQSRLTVLLKSATGSIVVSAVVFGLVHAPGLYLRGAESEGISESLPFLFWASYTIAYMSLAGIFLGIVWSKTKNLWLLMALHAMVDLLPNLPEFIRDWHL